MFRRVVLLLIVRALAACGARSGGGDARDGDVGGPIDAPVDVPDETCTPTIGDLGLPIEVRPVYVDYRGLVQPIGADGAVGLIFPPQGGYVLMVGLEARNLPGCGATVTGTVRDPRNGAQLSQEGRPTQLLVGADGWGHLGFPPVFTAANVATCPLSNGVPLPRDFDGNTWRLELTLVDARKQVAHWSGAIVPYCRPDDPDPTACPCTCDSDHVFGQPCPVDVDAGVASP